MDGYKTLRAWQHASKLCLDTLEAIESQWSPRGRVVLEQLSRAVVSVDVNIVEGYALGTEALYRRHLRIALGSAAEAERLLVIAANRSHLPQPKVAELITLATNTTKILYGVVRSRKLNRRESV